MIWQHLQLPPHSGKALAPLFVAISLLIATNFVTSLVFRLINKNSSSEQIAPFDKNRDDKCEPVPDKFFSFLIPTLSIQKSVYKTLTRLDFLGHEVDAFLFEASQNHRRVLVDTENRKVYLGIISSHLDRVAGDNTWISILPFKSGFRNLDDLSIEYTVQYEVVTYNLLSMYKIALEKRAKHLNCDTDKRRRVEEDLKLFDDYRARMRAQFPGVEKEELVDWVRFIPFERIISISPFNSKAEFVTDKRKKKAKKKAKKRTVKSS